MARRRLTTDVQIRALKCPAGRAYRDESLRDPRLPGLEIRVYASGRKVFFLACRFNRERRHLKLGVYSPPGFGLATARHEASLKLALIAKGEDPAPRRRKKVTPELEARDPL